MTANCTALVQVVHYRFPRLHDVVLAKENVLGLEIPMDNRHSRALLPQTPVAVLKRHDHLAEQVPQERLFQVLPDFEIPEAKPLRRWRRTRFRAEVIAYLPAISSAMRLGYLMSSNLPVDADLIQLGVQLWGRYQRPSSNCVPRHLTNPNFPSKAPNSVGMTH